MCLSFLEVTVREGGYLPRRSQVCVFLPLINGSPASERKAVFASPRRLERGQKRLEPSSPPSLQALGCEPRRIWAIFNQILLWRDKSDFMQEESPGFQLTGGHAADLSPKEKREESRRGSHRKGGEETFHSCSLIKHWCNAFAGLFLSF